MGATFRIVALWVSVPGPTIMIMGATFTIAPSLLWNERRMGATH
jgi:hypothetical protein